MTPEELAEDKKLIAEAIGDPWWAGPDIGPYNILIVVGWAVKQPWYHVAQRGLPLALQLRYAFERLGFGLVTIEQYTNETIKIVAAGIRSGK